MVIESFTKNQSMFWIFRFTISQNILGDITILIFLNFFTKSLIFIIFYLKPFYNENHMIVYTASI
jgi:hypothetical protein